MLLSDTTIISVVGILTSGVLGPGFAAWWARGAQRRAFRHDHAVRRVDDLRSVLDDAAVLLGAGATNLRRANEAQAAGRAVPPDIEDWAGRVHLASERLLLRFAEEDVVVQRYRDARDAMQPVQLAIRQSHDATQGAGLEVAITSFETARSAFLVAARAALARQDEPGSPRKGA